MPGSAAIAIWCDVAPAAQAEFDDWHAHEHMPERLAIPGFLRGSRWVSAGGGDGYFMLYEAASEAAITAGPYLERLNDPTPWSRSMMPHHRHMVRSPCRVAARFGRAWGQALLTVHFSPRDADRLSGWLTGELLPGLPARKGLVAAHFLRNLASADQPLTAEQRLRGGDAIADWIVLVSGYDAAAVASLGLDERLLVEHGAKAGCVSGLYRLAYVLSEAK